MRKFLVLLIFGFSFGLFGQPKAFDPNYYKDTLKVKKPDEFKILERYRKNYKSLKLEHVYPYIDDIYPDISADLYFYKGIDIERLDDYKKLGYDFKQYSPIILNPIFWNVPNFV